MCSEAIKDLLKENFKFTPFYNMDLTRLFDSVIKVKTSVLLYVAGLAVVAHVGIMIFLFFCWNSNHPNQEFYQRSITGTVTDVYLGERDVWYEIDQNWYVIINPLTNNLAIGDSVYKESDSHDIIIIYGSDNIKSSGEIEDVGFIVLKNKHPKEIESKRQ